MAGNFILASAKTILSLLSGSSALIADALHSFSDLLVSILVLAGLKFNRKKIEAIVTIIVGLFIISVAVGFAIELFTKEPVLIKNIAWAVSGQIIIIISTYLLYKYKTVIGTEEKSDSIIADGSHTKSDMLSSIGVLVSLTGTLVGLNLDRVAAFIIFFLILYQGLETIMSGISILRGDNQDSPYLYKFPFEKKIKVIVSKNKKIIAENKKKSMTIIGLLILIIYLIPGFYIVDESEEAVKAVLGIVKEETIKPGLHLNPLYLMNTIRKYETDKIKTMEYGFSYRDLGADDILVNQWETTHNSNKYYADEDEENVLTGDGSIVNINLIVEYRIGDPVKYQLSANEPDLILRIEIGSQLQKIAGSMPLFSALNTERKKIEDQLKIRLNESMAHIKTGIYIEDIFIHSLYPHLETVYMFRTVQDEEQNKETLLYDAEAVKEKQIPYYRGLAYEKIANAEADANEIILRAERDAIQYKILEKEYLKNKEALTFRLQLESRNKILKDSDKILIEESLNEGLIKLDQRSGDL